MWKRRNIKETIIVRRKIQLNVALKYLSSKLLINPLNAELNPICHLLALLGAHHILHVNRIKVKTLNPELNPIYYLLALLGAHHFLHVSRIRVKSLTLRRLMPYIYGAPILDVSRSHTTTQHSR